MAVLRNGDTALQGLNICSGVGRQTWSLPLGTLDIKTAEYPFAFHDLIYHYFFTLQSLLLFHPPTLYSVRCCNSLEKDACRTGPSSMSQATEAATEVGEDVLATLEV